MDTLLSRNDPLCGERRLSLFLYWIFNMVPKFFSSENGPTLVFFSLRSLYFSSSEVLSLSEIQYRGPIAIVYAVFSMSCSVVEVVFPNPK